MEKSSALRKARLASEISQADMAKTIGVSRGTYIKLEKNPDMITIAQAKAISKLLEISYEQLFWTEVTTNEHR